MPAEPSSPGRGGGSGVTRRVVTVLCRAGLFSDHPQARAAPEGDECCVLRQLLQHGTRKSRLRSQVPFVHLFSSQEPKALPSSEGPWHWHSLELSPWGKAQTGTAWHGLGCPAPAGHSSEGPARAPAQPGSQAPPLEMWNTSLHSSIQTVLEFASPWGKPALAEPLGCCRGVRACLSPTHLYALTPFLPLQVKDVYFLCRCWHQISL